MKANRRMGLRAAPGNVCNAMTRSARGDTGGSQVVIYHKVIDSVEILPICLGSSRALCGIGSCPAHNVVIARNRCGARQWIGQVGCRPYSRIHRNPDDDWGYQAVVTMIPTQETVRRIAVLVRNLELVHRSVAEESTDNGFPVGVILWFG